jgi:bis(5'-nucleosyl)-tetraphosphatase (symmetrical)
MATYAIGDIQGCFDTLQALLARVGYRRGRDELRLLGDLVNRGPRSLDVLRWAADEPGLRCVLGNHDLHLLARSAGASARRQSDTLSAVLAAPDRQRLIDWLRRQPLIVREGDWVLVHAGVVPLWDLSEAEERAREAERVLRGANWGAAVTAWRVGAGPDWGKVWCDAIDDAERFAFTLNALTRLRMCWPDGQMDLKFSGPPSRAPQPLRPWFDLSRKPERATIVFGHWAALGLFRRPGFVGLDSGCVWGRELTAMRLEDRELFHETARDG